MESTKISFYYEICQSHSLPIWNCLPCESFPASSQLCGRVSYPSLPPQLQWQGRERGQRSALITLDSLYRLHISLNEEGTCTCCLSRVTGGQFVGITGWSMTGSSAHECLKFSPWFSLESGVALFKVLNYFVFCLRLKQH